MEQDPAQFTAIWANRIRKEMDRLEQHAPPAAAVVSRAIDLDSGTCTVVLKGGAPGAAADDVLIELDCGVGTRYPFEPPRVRIARGEGPASLSDAPLLPPTAFLLGDAEWTPSENLGTVVAMVLACAGAAASTVPQLRVGEVLRLDCSPGLGVVFPCRSIPKSKLEELKLLATSGPRFFVATRHQVAQLEESRLRPGQATVLFCQPLSALAKLQFRPTGAVIGLMFSPPNVPVLQLELKSPSAASQCVEHIRAQMEQHGVSATRTSLAMARRVDRANKLVTLAQVKQLELAQAPSVALVEQIMDLFRQAAELYGAVGGDDRHEHVLLMLHDFLRSPEAQAALNALALEPEPASTITHVVDARAAAGSPPASPAANATKADDATSTTSAGERVPSFTRESPPRFDAAAPPMAPDGHDGQGDEGSGGEDEEQTLVI